MTTPKRRLYTGLKQTKRLLVLPEDIDGAFAHIAADEGTSVNSLLNDAALVWLTWYEKKKYGDVIAGSAPTEALRSSYAATNTSSPVHANLDTYSERLASVSNAYTSAVDKLSGGHPSSGRPATDLGPVPKGPAPGARKRTKKES